MNFEFEGSIVESVTEVVEWWIRNGGRFELWRKRKQEET